MKFLIFLFTIFPFLSARSNRNDHSFWKTDPELYMNTSQVIEYRGYPCENHYTTTDDGYILSLQRIPYGRLNKTREQRPVVFLQHGLIDSSFTWVNNYANQSLGFILADAGFDVWLGNSRGNVYSNRHIKFKSNSRKFWDFSWDEMAEFDLPASINFVINFTKVAKLSYVGHSEGTTIAFAKLSQNSVLNSRISSFTALAPVAYVGHLNTGIKYLSYIAGGFRLFFNFFSHGEFLPSDVITRLLAKFVCGDEYTKPLCSSILYLIAGFDEANLNMTRLPVYVAHCPAGTSVKNMAHFAKSYIDKTFARYDYGLLGNLLHYGQISPPNYELNTHSVPVGMFWGGHDDLADPSDVSIAIRQLGSCVRYHKYLPTYNHMDFIWGENSANILYKDVQRFIRRYL